MVFAKRGEDRRHLGSSISIATGPPACRATTSRNASASGHQIVASAKSKASLPVLARLVQQFSAGGYRDDRQRTQSATIVSVTLCDERVSSGFFV